MKSYFELADFEPLEEPEIDLDEIYEDQGNPVGNHFS